jgi:ribosomal protein S18 acetylase RimI-like enzyme
VTETSASMLAPRRLTADDLPAVCRVLEASDLAVVGFVDFTPEEVAADLRRDDLEAYGWYDDAGTLQGYGWVSRTADSNNVEVDLYVHPDHHDAALGHRALGVLEARGRELVAAGGYDEPWFGIGVYRADSRTRGWLEAAGYTVQTTFTRMRVDLDPAQPVEVASTGVVVRRVTDEPDLRAAYAIEEASFLEHYGNVPSTFERWQQRLAKQGPDWAQVFLGEVDGEPVGVMVTTRQFEPDEDAGYVRTLGVLPAARGRGVAKAMLRSCFAAAQAAGRKAVLLHVDVANVTGALGVYESVGMRPVLEIDAFAKGTSSVDAAPAG